MNAIESDCDIIQDCRASISNIEIQINQACKCNTSVTNICLKDCQENLNVIIKAIQDSFQELTLDQKKTFFPQINAKTSVLEQNERVESYLLDQCNTDKNIQKNIDLNVTLTNCSKTFEFINTNNPKYQCIIHSAIESIKKNSPATEPVNIGIFSGSLVPIFILGILCCCACSSSIISLIYFTMRSNSKSSSQSAIQLGGGFTNIDYLLQVISNYRLPILALILCLVIGLVLLTRRTNNSNNIKKKEDWPKPYYKLNKDYAYLE